MSNIKNHFKVIHACSFMNIHSTTINISRDHVAMGNDGRLWLFTNAFTNPQCMPDRLFAHQRFWTFQNSWLAPRYMQNITEPCGTHLRGLQIYSGFFHRVYDCRPPGLTIGTMWYHWVVKAAHNTVYIRLACISSSND